MNRDSQARYAGMVVVLAAVLLVVAIVTPLIIALWRWVL